MLLLAVAMAAMTVQADTAAQRQQFVACLRTAVTKAQGDKMKPAGFEPLARQMCASQITAFRTALVAYDVKAGSPRARAATDADAQISDYVLSASEKLDTGE